MVITLRDDFLVKPYKIHELSLRTRKRSFFDTIGNCIVLLADFYHKN